MLSRLQDCRNRRKSSLIVPGYMPCLMDRATTVDVLTLVSLAVISKHLSHVAKRGVNCCSLRGESLAVGATRPVKILTRVLVLCECVTEQPCRKVAHAGFCLFWHALCMCPAFLLDIVKSGCLTNSSSFLQHCFCSKRR